MIHTRLYSKVSIHAPVKEATSRMNQWFLYHGVSIHAPVKEATTISVDDITGFEFRSTPP